MSPPPPPRKFNINSKTITAPLAAFTMACLLFVYARTSIQAAKRNAQAHRESDGGQISWRNESLRRHGALEAPVEQGVVSQLVKARSGLKGAGGDAEGVVGDGGGRRSGETLEERRVREKAAGLGRGL